MNLGVQLPLVYMDKEIQILPNYPPFRLMN